MDSSEEYERPLTLYDLLARWATRDDVYSRRARQLSDEQVASIQAGRKQEASFLPPGERARAWAHVTSWYPPEHGQ